jgi:hypothetical protein
MPAKLTSLLEELAHYIPQASHKKEAVSAVDVAWHIEHTAISIRNVVLALHVKKEEVYQKEFNYRRDFVLFFGRIPRGKGKAPAAAHPKPETDLSAEYLQRSIQKAQTTLQKLGDLPNDAYFPHPYFGHLNPKQTERFLVVHTLHHLRIIQDIIRD